MLLPSSWLGLRSCCIRAKAYWDTIPLGVLSCMAERWLIALNKAFFWSYSTVKSLKRTSVRCPAPMSLWWELDVHLPKAHRLLLPWLHMDIFIQSKGVFCKTIWSQVGCVLPRLCFKNYIEERQDKYLQYCHSCLHIEQYRKENYKGYKWLCYCTVLTIFPFVVNSI